VRIHREPFVHLADLTHEHALIAWGAFFFTDPDGDGDGWRIVEDPDVHAAAGDGRRETIGVSSAPYGTAEVIVTDAATGAVVALATTSDANHVWVRGLAPDTEHTYRILIDGEPWGASATFDWVDRGDGPDLVRTDRGYDHRFRTFPAPDVAAPLRFAVLGDYGVGILGGDDDARRQLRIADALERAVSHAGVRLVLTTGDNVYLGEEDTADGFGDEDDDWYSSFYQPYRYVIDRVPFFPGVGNHDTGESERSDNRSQLADNLFTDLRFAPAVADGRAALDPGLYYRFRYGADIEFVCIDTTEAEELEGHTYFFDHPAHRDFLEASFPVAVDQVTGPRWRIPFTHHPPFTAGPDHENLQPLIDRLVPLLHRSRTPCVISGHEHNFQHNLLDGVHGIVSGAAGKLDRERPERFDAAGTRSWAAEGHLLIVDVDGERLTVHPVTDVDGDGAFTYLERSTPAGEQVTGPVEVEHG
jgi:tartrate-resistant acid phosphatase type 5